MSQPSSDRQRLRRRPRVPSIGLSGSGGASSSARPSSRPRTESIENVPTWSPTVSPPALPIRERCSSTPPVNWQYPSSSRCIVCGKLGCESCSVRADPAATKQRLDSLRLNTPYERAKLARSTDDLLSEEGRQRHRLLGRFESWLAGLRTTELLERHLVRVMLQEASCRESLYREEQTRRASSVVAADRYSVAVALQSSEAAARQATIAHERQRFAGLAQFYTHATQMQRLLQREGTTREALRYNEASQWHRLQTNEVEARRVMGEHVAERLRFGACALDSREEVIRQWQVGLEGLALAAADHCELLRQHQQQVRLLDRTAEQTKRDIAMEEAAARHRWRAEMAEEAEYLDERQRIFARQRTTFFKSEASLRLGICAEAEGGYHTIFLAMQADEEEVHEAEAQRADQRQSALLFALETLCSIQYEESEAFSTLRQKARDDVANRSVWVEEKAAARAALLQRCTAEKATVVAVEETQARAALSRARAADEVTVAECMAAKTQARAQLCTAAQTALAQIVAAEHAARFQLLSAMATAEEQVLRWCEVKRVTRSRFVENERTQRNDLAQQEEAQWQALCGSFVFCAKALVNRAAQREQAREKALAVSLDALHAVVQEESQAWTQLCSREAAQRDCAVEVFHFRCQIELLQGESQHRTLLAQDEAAARADLHTKLVLSARYAAEAALAAVRVQQAAMMAAEERARLCLYQHIEGWYNHLATQRRMEELQLITDEQQRIQDELRARQTYMTEDARLYNSEEEEPLVFASDGANAYGIQDDAISSSTHDVRRALVLQALGNPACGASLTAAAVELLVTVIDRAGRRRGAAEEYVAAAEHRARDASKRLVQLERVLAAEKEKKEMYEASAKREADERERRMQQELLDKARGQQTVHAEKRRLAEVQAELQEQQRRLDALKDSINKQFTR